VDPGPWTVAVLATKWLLYVAVALAIGASSTAWLLGSTAPASWRRRTLRLALGGCVLGALATGLHFLALLGDFARAGWRGLVDPALAGLLWDSPLGAAVFARVGGFGLIAVAIFCGGCSWPRIASCRSGPCPRLFRTALVLAWASGAMLLAYAFALAGHAAERGGAATVLLPLHVLAMAWWLGALPPLLGLCRAGRGQAELQSSMHRFGRLATWPVVLLVSCGIALIALLIDSPRALIGTAWGTTLGLKLLAVGAMLGFAAYHRWQLVPRLGRPGAASRLGRSIAGETLLAIAVLAGTAALSTLFGPAGG